MGSYALCSLERRRCSLCHDFDLLFVCFLLFCDFGRCWKDGNPMGAVWRGGAYMASSAERKRLKLHIILHSTAKFSFAANQLFILTTKFAGNTLWSFITPRSSHLQTHWPPLTSLLLLPTRFRSALRSLWFQTTPDPSPESGHLSTATTHHHGNHPGYRPIPGTCSSNHEQPTINVCIRCSPGNAHHLNFTRPIHTPPIANTTKWLQPHSRHCPRVG